MSISDNKNSAFAALYPQLSAEEQEEAEATIGRYLALVRRIYEYSAEHDRKVLTELRRRARLRKERGKALK